MNPIETRKEKRKRIERQRIAEKRKNYQYRESEIERERKRKRLYLRDPENASNKTNRQRSWRNKRRNITFYQPDYQTEEHHIPLHIQQLNEGFEKSSEQHSNWPQLVDSTISRNALSEFRYKTSFEELRELPCAVCSGLYSKDKWSKVSLKDINLYLLKAPTELLAPSFEIDFHYNHPIIDNTGMNILIDRAGFIYPTHGRQLSEQRRNPFDLRICHTCHNRLQKNKIPPLSLANNMWIGSTPHCLQNLTIPEQLLISPGYLCMNLIQITGRRHTHHKLKGHVITLPQKPGSLVNILPLPMYRLCEHLKVVFVGEGTPTDNQLKKILQVRKSKVAAALKWLFEHNILFKKELTLDDNALNALPEGDIPDALTVTTTAVNLNPQEYEHYTGYVHDKVDEDQEDINDDELDDNNNVNDSQFDYFPDNDIVGNARELRTSGILHVDNLPMSEREITLLSLQKIIDESHNHSEGLSSNTESSHNGIIRMPHAHSPLNEYQDTTLFPAGFPVLYPYGVGGHESENRSPHVSLKEYANHLMRHRDAKFRQHRSFPFVVFNVLQRREVSSEAYNLTKGSRFERSAELIASITLNDIKMAIEQEQNKQSITNPAVIELLRNVNSAGTKLMASHQSRFRMRNEMRAIIIRDGAPSLFITINPADLHSPIVMMYAGKEIDINNLIPENFPKAIERARLAHLDPSAVAKYFDIVIRCILDTVVGYGNINGGVFGCVKNYYGVVEYQDRGTPHCHMLIWLHGALDPIALRQRLINDEDFQQRLLDYVRDIVREDISYLLPSGEILTDDMIRAEYIAPKTVEEKRMHPSFFPIPDPDASNFEEQLRLDLLAIVKRTLIHSCTKTCKKYNRGSQHDCRFNFPRELVDPPGIIFPEQGIIAVPRVNAFVNNHNPYITAACRGNNDIKFISARKLALAYIHYITDYITKSDVSTHSSLLICASTLETFLKQTSDITSLDFVNRSRKFVAKYLNKLSGQMELTGPQVSAYLLGINDHYTPNKFVSIHLQTFEYYLTEELMKINKNNSKNDEDMSDVDNNNNDDVFITGNEELEINNGQNNNHHHEDATAESFLISSSNGRILATNLRVDYQFRGQELRDVCLYDYAATIKKVPSITQGLSIISSNPSQKNNARVKRFPFCGGNINCSSSCTHDGMHPQHGTHVQVHWRLGTEKVVILCGKGIPKKSDVEEKERYGLCILMLFKPWETVFDLLGGYDSWAEACQDFISNPLLSPRLLSVINNIELLHRCAEETILDRELRLQSKHDMNLAKAIRVDRSVPGYDVIEEELGVNDNEYIDLEEYNVARNNESNFNVAAIVRSGLSKPKLIDDAMIFLRLRGRLNIISQTSNLSTDSDNIYDQHFIEHDSIRSFVAQDEELIQSWRSTIASRKSINQDNNVKVNESRSLQDAYIESNNDDKMHRSLEAGVLNDNDPIEELGMKLNREQRKAFFLVCNHRRRNHQNSINKPSQLLLYLSGAGGTGKSRVIKAICEYFERTGKRDTLLVLAYTGIAASNISGNTIHSACGFIFGEEGTKTDNPIASTISQLQERWSKIEYVIIDEISVIGQRLLARFHKNVKLAKAVDSNVPFAGLNILFAGDFMQLPPVQDIALYATTKISQVALPSEQPKYLKHARKAIFSAGAVTSTIGKDLWLSVDHVVQLKEQMRQIDDPIYAGILESIRNGRLSEEQRQILRSRILHDNRVNTREWKDAVFLVSRNQIRVQMNFDATLEFAKDNNEPILYSCAEDSYKRVPLQGRIRRNFLSVTDTNENALCGILPLCIGMKVALTVNVCTNDGLANGAQGIIRQIVYDEKSVNYINSRKNHIILKNVPKYVVIELIDKNPGPYNKLLSNHVPIYPVKATCVRTIWQHNGKSIRHNFQRNQLPLTPAYAFTDYKCQGQTIKKAIVDLAEGCSSTGMYVMLSRVRRLEDLLILRPFNESLLDVKIPASLHKEFKRHNDCAHKTNRLEKWPNDCIIVP